MIVNFGLVTALLLCCGCVAPSQAFYFFTSSLPEQFRGEFFNS
jgi:hypothetical protein